MSDTPRTDNETRDYFLRFDTGGESVAQLFEFRRVDGGVVVDADFARELERELNKVRAVLADPAAVWANMLRGEIARPGALDHYEACKQRVETLERENADLDKRLQEALDKIERLEQEIEGLWREQQTT